ncbi:MAG: trigger factor [Acidimicrobiales bacterium]
MRATSEAVEGNKVRLSVEIDETEIADVLGETIRTLSRQARVPGFRPGKVPRQVLEARMGGAGALRTEALREAIPDFYARALAESELDPIAPPEIDITSGQEDGALAFDAVVQVRPVVPVPGYAGLKVRVPSPSVSEAEIDAQVDRLRETDAELVEVDRPARDGDHVTIDVHGTLPEGGEAMSAEDLLYEVGSGRIVDALDVQLRGAKVGDVLSFDSFAPGTNPEDREVAFRVLLKEVKEKKLPPVSDEWAADASEFATLEDLRADLRERLERVKISVAQLTFRQGALGALAELVEDDQVPELLVAEEVDRRLQELGSRLQQQGMALAQFLEMTGRKEDQLLESIRLQAREEVKSDLALRSVAEEESLEVSEEELETELAEMASRLHLEPAVVRERLTRAGRIAAVRSEQRKAKALAWLLDHVEVVDEEGAPVSLDDLRADRGTEVDASAGGPEEGVGGISEGAVGGVLEQAAAELGAGVTNGESEA